MQDVLVILFAENGFDRAAEGLLGAGRSLTSETGGKLVAAVVGEDAGDAASQAARFADSVFVLNQTELAEYQPETCLSAVKQIGEQVNPFAVLLGNDTYSQETSARLAFRLGGSAAGDGFKLQAVNGKLRVTRQAYGGKALAVVELKKNPAVAWLRARAFEPAQANQIAAPIEQISLELPPETRVRIIERKKESATGDARLEDAQIIVSGGRGLGGVEQFAELKKLADVLEAQIAASRAACDAGWVSPTLQVGQTGKKVAPELYLAVGISGASQHLAGMSDSKVIAAINSDPNAPILKHCQFGLVEDYKKVLPLLVEKLRELKK
jgi:electron transfer flavoprotein alpha subunit